MFPRLTTLACSWALIVAWLAAPLHLAFARHAICAEHGEVVDREEWAGAPSTGQPGLSERSAEIAPVSGHHHCLSVHSLRSAGLGFRPAFGALARAPAEPSPLGASPAYIREPSRILRDAPKASPPRGA